MLQLNSSERELLLALVREAVGAHLAGREPRPVQIPSGPLHETLGVFVSIHRGDRLRGCIGRYVSTHPLYEAAAECGIAAATADPRFSPVEGNELDAVHFELSVLSEPRPARPETVEVGRHGLIVESRNRRGLLLPQVASRQGWDSLEFLSQTCLKAGLPADAWHGDAAVMTFEALVFSEAY
jgi:AmmeMemoRadiSam system protein A